MNELERAREILFNWDEWHKQKGELPTEPGALRIMRNLLLVAEAAEKVNALGGTFYDERLYCRHCSAEVGRPHHKDCYISALEDALKGLDE